MDSEPNNHNAGAVLVTGGAGYLGSVLTPMLLDNGKKVKIIDLFCFGSDPIKEFKNHPNVAIVQKDILFQDNDPDLFKGIDTVAHLASISNDPSCDINPNWSIQTNFLATMALARRAKCEGIRRFIFISTCSVYGAAGDQFLDESSPTGPVTLYALTKMESERELLKLSSSNFSVTILRFATLFGLSPRMRFDLSVNTMIKRALQNQSIIVHGEGNQYRPFLHVRDAAHSILASINVPTSKVANEIFNIGDESLNYPIDSLAREIASNFPNVKIERDLANNDIRSYRPKFLKFRDTLKISTKYRISDAVQEISEAYYGGLIGSMDEEKYYNLETLRRGFSDPFKSNLAASKRWLSVAGQKG